MAQRKFKFFVIFLKFEIFSHAKGIITDTCFVTQLYGMMTTWLGYHHHPKLIYCSQVEEGFLWNYLRSKRGINSIFTILG